MSEQDYRQIIADNLQFFLDLNNVKPVDLARKLNVSESTVSRWLSAKTSPYMDKVDEMAAIFMVRRSDIITPREEDQYYIDAGTRSKADMLLRNPKLGFLLDAVSDISEKDVEILTELAKKIQKEERGDDEA